MEDLKVVIALRDEDETWTTTIMVTELEALRIRNLRPFTPSGPLIDLPSVSGFAQVKGDTLKISYKSGQAHGTISTPFLPARDVIDDAIERERNRAAAERRSAAGWQRIWDWMDERSTGAQWFKPPEGEQVHATLLMTAEEHIAIQLDDGTLAVASVANQKAIPPIGSSINLERDGSGDTILSTYR
ncbi:hypothetical protein K6L27_32755 [Burkholderia cenocepacia]|uniref:hypothetical protein n=1 Tax=Burkholderia cenocepacia TaxID=95486 RepID=UPI002231229C|nr:hypothetical protein [Burkholderia cenocepacia]MCW3662990.1 hypothetical protein [Burkholderia cenocepacia]